MNRAKQWTLGGIIGTVVGILTIWTMLDPWPKFGWTTPDHHKADIAIMEEEHQESQQGWKNFRDEWKCDEHREELNDLIERWDSGEHTEALRLKIAGKARHMNEKNCGQFEE